MNYYSSLSTLSLINAPYLSLRNLLSVGKSFPNISSTNVLLSLSTSLGSSFSSSNFLFCSSAAFLFCSSSSASRYVSNFNLFSLY
jgi:hypothetical protein